MDSRENSIKPNRLERRRKQAIVKKLARKNLWGTWEERNDLIVRGVAPQGIIRVCVNLLYSVQFYKVGVRFSELRTNSLEQRFLLFNISLHSRKSWTLLTEENAEQAGEELGTV